MATVWTQTPTSAANSQGIVPVIVDQALVGTLTAAAAASASPTMTNTRYSGIRVCINISALAGTSPTLTVTIYSYDSVSGQASSRLASTALSATGTTILEIYPSVTAIANLKGSGHLGAQWQIGTAIGGTSPTVTATINCVLLP